MGQVPSCKNGFIEINSENHVPSSTLFSSTNTTEMSIHLNKLYPVKLSLLVDGEKEDGLAFISFVGDEVSSQATIPDSATINLETGFYNVTVYQYGNTSIKIPASSSKQCIEATSGGILGFFGKTEEQCFDVDIPATTISSALTAGGQGEVYLTEELLQRGEFSVSVNSLPLPNSVDSLQTNYALFETQGVDIIYE
jgi:hypothetical protein